MQVESHRETEQATPQCGKCSDRGAWRVGRAQAWGRAPEGPAQDTWDGYHHFYPMLANFPVSQDQTWGARISFPLPTF